MSITAVHQMAWLWRSLMSCGPMRLSYAEPNPAPAKRNGWLGWGSTVTEQNSPAATASRVQESLRKLDLRIAYLAEQHDSCEKEAKQLLAAKKRQAAKQALLRQDPLAAKVRFFYVTWHEPDGMQSSKTHMRSGAGSWS
jgi:hypothetical protein